MRLSFTLSAYIGRQFLFWVSAAFFALLAIVFLLDFIELLRRASGRETATFLVILQMALFKLPQLAQKLAPFALLFGSMLAFLRLTKSHELAVVRAAGISAWQFLTPALVIAGVLGALQIMAFSPLASILLARYETLENEHFKGRGSLLAVSASGLWLRQGDGKQGAVIHALRVAQGKMELQDVTFYLFEDQDRFLSRIDAAKASLQPGHWDLTDAWITLPGGRSTSVANHRLPTDLTLEKIQESFASPETMSFWELPGFIRVLEAAGFSGHRHRLYLHSQMAIPALLCGMVLIAATFSMRQTRRGGAAYLVGAGILSGFLLYFMSDVIHALGMSATIPVVMAAWTPAGISLLIGISLILHLEDG